MLGTAPFASHLLTTAICLRVGLFAFSVWQDTTRWPDGQLRFTDVDYDVFTDASKALVAGRDIYEARPTYRYSPLIAALLAPGHLAFRWLRLKSSYYPAAYAFGKMIFILADIFCALLQRRIIMLEGQGRQSISWLVGAFWLFNPITAAVSVRGNAESVLGCCVLACLLCVLQHRVVTSGLFFGLCIHLKLYPIIYSPAIYLYMCGGKLGWRNLLLPNQRHWAFGIATLSSLLALTGLCYAAYGWTFLHHAYFYHFSRVDLWHNFAPHFYPIYLFEGSLAQMAMDKNESAVFDANLWPYNYLPRVFVEQFFREENLHRLYAVFKVAIMLPSAILIVALAFRLYKQPSFAWFATTFVFVSFNKVCTSQYFLWWLVLLPPALAHIRLPSSKEGPFGDPFYRISTVLGLGGSDGVTALRRCCFLTTLWSVSQGLWLAVAYLHEMQGGLGGLFWGRWLWLGLWTASLQFLVVNVFILRRLMQWLEGSRNTNTTPTTGRTRRLSRKEAWWSVKMEKQRQTKKKEIATPAATTEGGHGTVRKRHSAKH